jgi:hypothetical protein
MRIDLSTLGASAPACPAQSCAPCTPPGSGGPRARNHRHNLNFVIAADVITGMLKTGKVRFYPIFVLAADQFRFASMLDTLGFQVLG